MKLEIRDETEILLHFEFELDYDNLGEGGDPHIVTLSYVVVDGEDFDPDFPKEIAALLKEFGIDERYCLEHGDDKEFYVGPRLIDEDVTFTVGEARAFMARGGPVVQVAKDRIEKGLSTLIKTFGGEKAREMTEEIWGNVIVEGVHAA